MHSQRLHRLLELQALPKQGKVVLLLLLHRHHLSQLLGIDTLLTVQTHPGDDAAAQRNIELPGRPEAAFYTGQWRRLPQGPLEMRPDPASGRDPATLVPGTDFYAQGQHGQYIFVAPRQRTVVVRLGTDRRPGTWWPGVLGRIARSGLDGTEPVVEALSAR